MVWMSDVMFGLIMTSIPRRLYIIVFYLLAGLWSGNHLPAMVQMNDVVFGLNMTSTLRRLYIVLFYFPLQDFFLIVYFSETSLVFFGIKL